MTSLNNSTTIRSIRFLPPIFLLGFLAITQAALGDPSWAVRTWQIPDTSNNVIAGIAQSPDGYLWIATSAGLNRFDGVQFEHYPLGARLGVEDSSVRMILPSRSGGLWVAMQESVLFLKLNAAPQLIHDKLPTQRADSMIEDSDGALWIAYRAGPVYRILNGDVTVYTSNAGFPKYQNACFAIDTRNQLWLARGDHIGTIRDGHYSDVIAAPLSTRFTSLACRKSGGLWITYGFALYKYDDGKLTAVATLPLNRPDGEQLHLAEDRQGTLWIGTTSGGLFRYGGSGFETIPTPQAKITCFAEDREGNLWAGTDVGLDRIWPRTIETQGAEAGLPLGALNSICQTPDGQMWGIAADGSVKIQRDNRWIAAPFHINDNATCITGDERGAIWMGTNGQHLYRWQDNQLTSWEGKSGLAGGSVSAMLVAKNHDVWIGSIDTVQCLRDGHVINVPLPITGHHAERRISAIAEDQQGTIWVGSLGAGGLIKIKDDKATEEIPHPISALYVSPDNTLWIGYRAKGLGRLKDGHFSFITSKEGLYEDHVAQIVPDDHGWLWLGSDHGIFRVRQKELDDVADGHLARVQSVHYGGDEGLPSLYAKTRASSSTIRAQNGQIWMTMSTELAIVHPERVREQLEPPPVYVQRVIVDDKTIASSGDYLALGEGNPIENSTSTWKLPPNYHRLEFDFTALTFTSPENARFRYRLENFDENWNETTNPRIAVYPKLPAGDYHFQVTACNADGIWSQQATNIAFSVAPFFWQTWWFQTAALATFSAILLLLARYVSFRRLRRRLQIAEQRNALDRERARIARDIHDDLGCGLTKIVLLSELSMQAQSPTGDGAHIRQIVSTAKQQIKSLDETVWAINPRNDTLPDLIDYIANFVIELLRAAGIECHLDLPDDPPDQPVASEIRHSLFLVVKEAINNVIRHAHASEVWMSITLSCDAVAIEIADNGHGFLTAPDEPEQDGLRNMERRMQDISGTFLLKSSPATGTKVSFRYPWPTSANVQTTPPQ